MDPATAFSVVCGSLQIVEQGIKAVQVVREIHKSKDGLSEEYDMIASYAEALSTSYSQISAQLQSTNQTGLNTEKAHLKTVAIECGRVAENLGSRLEKLHKTNPRPGYKAVGQWARLQLSKDDIEKDRDRLDKCQKLLDTQLLVNLCNDVQNYGVEQLQSIDKVRMENIRTLDVFKQMSNDFQASFQSTLDQISMLITDQSEETRRLILSLQLENTQRDEFEQLLAGLGFPTMTQRQEDLYDPYPGTFEWMLDGSSASDESHNFFVTWLEEGDGLFWINGKPGSGKSTMMKFLTENPKTERYLSKWSTDDHLTMPRFFFWRAGSPEQRSINGLLRSILYQLLSADRSLSRYTTSSTYTERDWPNKRLENSLTTIAQQRHNTRKMCLFIDGLDEFEDQGMEPAVLIDLIENLTRNNHIKAVISCRPEPLFLDRLQMYPEIRLQDLTWQDMLAFVRERLLQQSYIQELEESDGLNVNKYAEMVTRKADGVFLWARLALRDILDGVLARDSPQMLEDRLEYLSTSLDGIFTQLLGKIHPVHQQSASTYLYFENYWHTISYPNSNKLSIPIMALGCDQRFYSQTRSLMLTDARGPSAQVAVENCFKTLRNLSTQLTSRCGGLLEVKTSSVAFHQSNRFFKLLGIGDGLGLLRDLDLSPLARYYYEFQTFTRVQMIHRSAWDFLNQNTAGQILMGRSSLSSDQAIKEALARTSDGAALMWLFVAMDCYHIPAYSETHGTWALLENMVACGPDDLHAEAPEIEKMAGRRFIDELSDALRHDHESTYGKGDSIYFDALDQRRQTIVLLFDRFAQQIKKLGAPLRREKSHFPCVDMYPILLELLGCLPVQHVWLWLAIIFGHFPYALQVFDSTYESSIPHFFEAAIFALVFHRLQLGESRTESAFKVLHKFLEIGLGPNEKAGAEAFLSPSPNTLAWSIYQLNNATNWQLYLSFVDWTGRELSKFESTEYLISGIHTLTESFLKHGADANAMLEIRYPIPANEYLVIKDPELRKGKPELFRLSFDISARVIIQQFNDYFAKKEHPAVKSLFDLADALPLMDVNEIWIKKTAASEDERDSYFKLDWFNAEQLQELHLQVFKLSIVIHHSTREEVFDDFNEAVLKMFMENAEHVEVAQPTFENRLNPVIDKLKL